MQSRSIKGKAKKEGKIVGAATAVSGAGSFISAHNVCHTICLGAVAVLSFFGIAASSDILMFLQDYNPIFWTMGIFFLFLSLLLLVKYGPCISKKMIVGNVGLLFIGVPFFKDISGLFMVLGSSILLVSILTYLDDKFDLNFLRRL